MSSKYRDLRTLFHISENDARLVYEQRFNSFNYSCCYVGDSISDLLLGEVWRCLAVLDSDVCIDVLSAVR